MARLELAPRERILSNEPQRNRHRSAPSARDLSRILLGDPATLQFAVAHGRGAFTEAVRTAAVLGAGVNVGITSNQCAASAHEPAEHIFQPHPEREHVRDLRRSASALYLHYVFDLWVSSWRKKHARGEVYVVRYADDLVAGFQREEDARAMHSALAGRLARFGLELHPDKTRVLEFGRFARVSRERRGLPKPETFDFLGFTHIMSLSRHGKPLLHRRTSRKKRQAKLANLRRECRERRHDPAVAQHAWLCQVLEGHYRYYGVPTNYQSLRCFQQQVE